MENNGRTKTRWNRTETVKHAKNLIKQGDKEGCYYVLIFIAIFIPSKNPHTKPYNISVTRLVSLGYLCSQPHCVPLDTHNIDTNCILSHHSHLRQRFRACVITLTGNRPHRDRGGGGGGLSYLSVLKGEGRRLEEGISAIVNGGSCCLLAVLYSFKNLPRLITITLSRDIRRGLWNECNTAEGKLESPYIKAKNKSYPLTQLQPPPPSSPRSLFPANVTRHWVVKITVTKVEFMAILVWRRAQCEKKN